MTGSTLISRRPCAEFWTVHAKGAPVLVDVSCFHGPSGVKEFHFVAHPIEYGGFETQLEWVANAYDDALASAGLEADTAVFRRFTCSDPMNQSAALEKCLLANGNELQPACAVSIVGQPPMPPAKVAMWAYHIHDPGATLDKQLDQGTLSLRRGGLTHHWTTGMVDRAHATTYDQTAAVFESYAAWLDERNLTLRDHAVRTWLFVQNIDAEYHDMVAARRDVFERHGLTSGTHYIASTGIQGTSADPSAKIVMDAYTIGGVQPGQVQYVSAPEHLSPTQLYGVTFERATTVDYQDRRHVILSGTASVDAHGEIVYPGDVSRQLDRTLDNVEALLAKSDVALHHLGMCIAYARDPSDLPLISSRIRKRLGAVPILTLTAPVCRPGWLVEIEGIAIVPASDPELPAF